MLVRYQCERSQSRAFASSQNDALHSSVAGFLFAVWSADRAHICMWLPTAFMRHTIPRTTMGLQRTHLCRVGAKIFLTVPRLRKSKRSRLRAATCLLPRVRYTRNILCLMKRECSHSSPRDGISQCSSCDFSFREAQLW